MKLISFFQNGIYCVRLFFFFFECVNENEYIQKFNFIPVFFVEKHFCLRLFLSLQKWYGN